MKVFGQMDVAAWGCPVERYRQPGWETRIDVKRVLSMKQYHVGALQYTVTARAPCLYFLIPCAGLACYSKYTKCKLPSKF